MDDEDFELGDDDKEEEPPYYKESSMSLSQSSDEAALLQTNARWSQRSTAGKPPARYMQALNNLAIEEYANALKKPIFIENNELPVLGQTMSQLSLNKILPNFGKMAKDGAMKEMKKLHEMKLAQILPVTHRHQAH